MSGVETSEATVEAAREGETATTTSGTVQAAAGRGKESRATGHGGTAAEARGTTQGEEIRKGTATGRTAAVADRRSDMATAEAAPEEMTTIGGRTDGISATAMTGRAVETAGKSDPAHPQASQLVEVSRLCRWTRQYQARARPGSSCPRQERAFSRIGLLLERRPSGSASCRSSRSSRMTGWEGKCA